MDKQFTASEVREYANYDDSPEREMLNSFADLLEAREKAVPVAWEKAVPVAWVNPDDLANPVFAGVNVAKATHPDLGRHYTQPLYTHPAPSDAERLAEALREQATVWTTSPLYIGMADEDELAVLEACAKDVTKILAAHATQAQPPAASVTDAKDAARYRWIRLHYDVSASRHGVNDLLALRLPQQALPHTGQIMDSFVDNAMIAAQENPNG